LPELQPFENASERIASSDWLGPDDRDFMASELARLQAGYARLEFVLPRGVIHGDASIGNVLRDPGGRPAVIDLDDFATGPREWDLIQTAIYKTASGGTRARNTRPSPGSTAMTSCSGPAIPCSQISASSSW
jgi:Ser/Thr protein kinase RdoA (MazF antagonist)